MLLHDSRWVSHHVVSIESLNSYVLIITDTIFTVINEVLGGGASKKGCIDVYEKKVSIDTW